MTSQYVVEIWQNGERVASVCSSDAETALSEAASYAFVYGQDGPVRIKVKNPKEQSHDR